MNRYVISFENHNGERVLLPATGKDDKFIKNSAKTFADPRLAAKYATLFLTKEDKPKIELFSQE
jgi:hypothetical protein